MAQAEPAHTQVGLPLCAHILGSEARGSGPPRPRLPLAGSFPFLGASHRDLLSKATAGESEGLTQANPLQWAQVCPQCPPKSYAEDLTTKCDCI